MIREDKGLTLENANKELLGTASKVVITKDSTLIVTDGGHQEAVNKRVSQIQNLVEVCIAMHMLVTLLSMCRRRVSNQLYSIITIFLLNFFMFKLSLLISFILELVM